MKNSRCYYAADIRTFLAQAPDQILGGINRNNTSAEVTERQQFAWIQEIDILRHELASLEEGRIIFEYVIPRRGKRVDVVILYHHIIFLLEFKCGEEHYLASACNQVYDYALDLHYFQKSSHDKLIVPVMVPTEATTICLAISCKDRVIAPLGCGACGIAALIRSVCARFPAERPFNYAQWEDAEYCPTPTIVEAAQALYSGHNVEAITRSDAGAENLTKTTSVINGIITRSKLFNEKSICFVTGVPGAGKTLVGLNLAVQHSNSETNRLAVFLSGNFSLVKVLQEALARDKVAQGLDVGLRIKKAEALRETSTFIQIIHTYRDFFVSDERAPRERVAIFDESQRAWTHQKIETFMRTKKGISAFPYSEPEFLIQTMDRHGDWSVIVCLVGGGQEINDGEAGLPEWFDALRRSFPHWHVYVSPHLTNEVYMRGREWGEMVAGLSVREEEALHLATSLRAFRAPEVSDFVDTLLAVSKEEAMRLWPVICNSYPIVVTRDLGRAKAWVKEQCRGSMRCGVLASSGALRLKAEGLFVKSEIAVENWFLNPKGDVRSSYQLEDVATEFSVQGLELDYAVVAWDADFAFHAGGWLSRTFSGTSWKCDKNPEQVRYRKNAYRVLLTRARQGMVIFVPRGDRSDPTRDPAWYDGTYAYLRALGIPALA